MSWPADAEERAEWAKTYDGVHIAWADASSPAVDLHCRNCGAPGLKPALLEAQVTLRNQGLLTSRLVDCPACGCAFARDESIIDYELVKAEPISVEYYVEVGAGLWPITCCLARVRAPAGSRYLEIGCGFGFGLDFALRERGWAGRGIDPSPIAVAARDKLGLQIENRYFLNSEAAATQAAVVLASEVVEHMGDPLAFVQTLRAALAPGGTLVLTTPDRAYLRQDVPLAQIVPILSVGAHVVLETAGSLRRLLERAGFQHVEVLANTAQLVAYASMAPLELERDEAVLRATYRGYLERRTRLSHERDYVWWGFVGRAYQEAVVDHDWPVADELWRELRDATSDRFRFDLDDPTTVPNTRGLELWELPSVVPKALPSLLQVRLLHRIEAGGETLAQLEPLLRAIISAAVDLNAALRADASEDQQTLEVERRTRGTLAGVAADAGRDDTLDLLRQAAEAEPARAPLHARRCLVGLVNAGAIDSAKRLIEESDVGLPALDRVPPGQPLSTLDRDALFCLGILELETGGQLFSAVRRFARAREGISPDQPLWWAALRGECIAGDRMKIPAHADTLLAAAPLATMPADLISRRPPG